MDEKKRKKRKHRPNYYILVVNDNPETPAWTRRFTYGSIIFWSIVFGIVVAFLVGFVAFVNYNSSVVFNRNDKLMATVDELTTQNETLLSANAALNDKITILSQTVNQKVEVEQQIEEKYLPTGYPLSDTATIEETTEKLHLNDEDIERPMMVFTSSNGTYVVAAGDGIVSMVKEEATYGWEVRIDHGNGYVTSYRTSAKPNVKEGDEVSRNGVLFELDSSNDDAPQMAYQILQNDEYINPADMLEING